MLYMLVLGRTFLVLGSVWTNVLSIVRSSTKTIGMWPSVGMVPTVGTWPSMVAIQCKEFQGTAQDSVTVGLMVSPLLVLYSYGSTWVQTSEY
jgi:hypothetical protein